MRVLFITPTFLDYGLDTLYDGLVQHLGSENVIEYPQKPVLHGDKQRRFHWYPCFFNHPIVSTDALTTEKLRKNEFDSILIGCRYITDFPNNEFFDLLKVKAKVIPTFLIDQGDEFEINDKLIKDFNPQLYFKREFFPDKNANKKVVPLSFSFSLNYTPYDTSITRKNNLFWAGTSSPSREPYLEICRDSYGYSFPNYYHDDYHQMLLSNSIGLNLMGRGNDTVRYYEVPAHGTLLFSQKPEIEIENAFVDGKTAVIFENTEEMKEKLDFCLSHQAYVDKIRKVGLNWYHTYHTSKIRASQMMAKITSTT